MAEYFGGGSSSSSRIYIYTRNNNCCYLVVSFLSFKKKKLEKEQGLTLDPPRNHHHHHYHGTQQQQQQQEEEQEATTTTTTTTKPSRLGMTRNNNNTGGEIVEVQGGHIVRSTGRKDRHSKVCTAKGPRDRRVRLSAHTAIQFYDVQDRLGYDRPSKAVDWLMKKAKPAIDELAELPAWTPTAVCATTTKKRSTQQEQQQQQQQQQQAQMNEDAEFHEFQMMDSIGGGGSSNSLRKPTMMVASGGNNNEVENIHQQQPQHNNSSFLPASMDSDSIADTIKTFFPTGATSQAEAQYQGYAAPPPPDLLSRSNSRSQDLRLSLQSFQDPMLLHSRPSPSQNEQQQQHVPLFSGAPPPHSNTHLGFLSDVSGWAPAEHHHHQHHQQHQNSAEIGRLQRMVMWNGGAADSGGGGGSGGGGNNLGFFFNSLPQAAQPPAPAAPPPMLQPLLQNQFFTSQRGPLQSSNMPSVRAWIDPSIYHHPSAFSGTGFANTVGGFSGFHIPARIQGEEEEQHDGIHNKPSSASSDSRH
ncbi:hypothetical protein ACFE04_004866 [Oxalis oulophora]